MNILKNIHKSWKNVFFQKRVNMFELAYMVL